MGTPPGSSGHNEMKTALGLLLATLACSASAVTLRVGTLRVLPGVATSVPVSLHYGTNEPRDVVAFQADVVFDAAGVADATPIRRPLLSQHLVASSQPEPGTRRLLVYALTNSVLANGELLLLPFTVGAGEHHNFPLTLTNIILVRADASTVPASPVDGYLAVNPVSVGPEGKVDGILNVASNEVEQCYVVQATTNFVEWVNVDTNSALGSLLNFSDATAGGHPHRFYRAIGCVSLTGLRLGAITRLPDRQVQFAFNGAIGHRYVVQASTNLAEWINLRTNVGAGGPVVFTESTTHWPHRFYRVQELP